MFLAQVDSGKYYCTVHGKIYFIVEKAGGSLLSVRAWDEINKCWGSVGQMLDEFLVKEVECPEHSELPAGAV